MGIENLVLPTAPGAESPSAPSVSRCARCAWNWVGLRNTCCISKILHSPDFALSYLPFVEPWEVKNKIAQDWVCPLWDSSRVSHSLQRWLGSGTRMIHKGHFLWKCSLPTYHTSIHLLNLIHFNLILGEKRFADDRKLVPQMILFGIDQNFKGSYTFRKFEFEYLQISRIACGQ